MKRYDVIQRQTATGERIICLADYFTQSAVEIVPEIGFHVLRMSVLEMDWIAGPPDLETLKQRSSEFGFPILSPPNRILNAAFSFEDKAYRFPKNDNQHHIHGEIRHKPWDVVEFASNDGGAYVTAVFRYADDASIQAYFPHPLIFTFTYQLQEGRLLLFGSVKNDGHTNTPFGLGFHPYFSLFQESADDVEIKMPVLSQYELDSGGFPTGIPYHNELCSKLNEGMKLSEIPKDQDHMLFKLDDSVEIHDCQLIFRKMGLVLSYIFDSTFPFGVLFKPTWMNGLSIEAYTCITDAFSSKLPKEHTGKLFLRPNETYEFRTCVEIHRLTAENNKKEC